MIRSLAVLAGFFGCCLLLLACIRVPQVPQEPRGTLRFAGSPATATVDIDETPVGPLGLFSERGLLLRPGTHRIKVTAPGFFPEYRSILIENAKTDLMVIQLREIPE